MRICFDFEFKEKDAFDKCTPEQQIALGVIEEAVYQRIKEYEQEIDIEELLDENSVVMIYLLTSPKAIQPKNYSSNLSDRIISKLDREYIAEMWQSVENALSGFSN